MCSGWPGDLLDGFCRSARKPVDGDPLQIPDLRADQPKFRHHRCGNLLRIVRRECSEKRATLNDRAMKEAFGRGHRHQCSYLSTTSRLAKDRYIAGIAAERCNVRMDPLEQGHNVEHSNVCRVGEIIAANGGKIKVPIYVEAVIVIHQDDIVIAGEAFAIVGEEIVIATAGISPAVHVDHHGALIGAVNLRCPDVHSQTIFARHPDICASME